MASSPRITASLRNPAWGGCGLEVRGSPTGRRRGPQVPMTSRRGEPGAAAPQNPQALERFQPEAGAALARNHSNICAVHEISLKGICALDWQAPKARGPRMRRSILRLTSHQSLPRAIDLPLARSGARTSSAPACARKCPGSPGWFGFYHSVRMGGTHANAITEMTLLAARP